MYDLIKGIIAHEWISNYSGDQQYVYYIAGAIIIILLMVIIDLVYRVFAHFWH